MERPNEREASERASDDGSDGSDDETVHRMVEAGAGADVPVDDDGEPDRTTAEPDGGAPSPGPPGETTSRDEERADAEERVDAEDRADADESDESEDREPADENDVPPEIRDLLAEEGTDRDAGAPVDDDDGPPVDDVGDSADDDGEVPRDEDGTVDEGPEAATGDASASASEASHSVEEHRPGDPTELARPEDASRLATPDGDETDPAAEAEPVSVRSEMSPALAERQAFVSLLLALVAGGLLATLGNVLQLTRWQTLMVLVSAGIVVLLITTFVVFRAMLAAAERNDEPYRTAYTHPLFMFLFVLTTTVTALFVGYVSRLVT